MPGRGGSFPSRRGLPSFRAMEPFPGLARALAFGLLKIDRTRPVPVVGSRGVERPSLLCKEKSLPQFQKPPEESHVFLLFWSSQTHRRSH